MPSESNHPSAPSRDTEAPSTESGFPFFAIGMTVMAGALTGLFWSLRGNHSALEIGFVISAATLISILIWQACDPFADAAQWFGKRFRIPSSVRGATLDAVASSMPELFTGLFFVTIALTSDKSVAERLQASADGYGSTIATCAGSSIYNMILIPAICAIAISYSRQSKPEIEVASDVLKRDGSWVLFTQLGLLIFLFQPSLTWWMGVAALVAYAAYIIQLWLATRSYRSLDESEPGLDELENAEAGVFFGLINIRLNVVSALMVLAFSTAVAAAACYFLVELTQSSAESLGVPAFFVAVILTAAVSSIPDTFMSLGAARRGDDSGAISNVFGSNIFDICVGMSIPLLVSCYLNDWQPITLIDEHDQTMRGVVGLRVFLFVITVVAMSIMWRKKKITSRTGWFFTVLYASFVLYAILGATGILPA